MCSVLSFAKQGLKSNTTQRKNFGRYIYYLSVIPGETFTNINKPSNSQMSLQYHNLRSYYWRLETFILRYNDANIEILFKFSLY